MEFERDSLNPAPLSLAILQLALKVVRGKGWVPARGVTGIHPLG